MYKPVVAPYQPIEEINTAAFALQFQAKRYVGYLSLADRVADGGGDHNVMDGLLGGTRATCCSDRGRHEFYFDADRPSFRLCEPPSPASLHDTPGLIHRREYAPGPPGVNGGCHHSVS